MTDELRPPEPDPAPAAPSPEAEPVPATSMDLAAVPSAPPLEPPIAPPPSPVAPPPAAPPIAASSPIAAAPAPVVTTATQARRPRRWPRTLRSIVAFLFGILQALLIIRILLLVLNANPDDEIVAWVLRITDPFVEPFRGMFSLDEIEGQRGAVVDVAAIVALIAWSLVETLLLSVLRLFDRGARRA